MEYAQRSASLLGFPVVFKSPEGFASSGVKLIKSESDLINFLQANYIEKADLTDGMKCMVIQKYIPGLLGDWKIIVVGKYATSLYRKVRPNDFRASGSGLFEFRKAPDFVLEFAYQTRLKLNAPWISCDIAEKNDECILLEYQVVHFGTVTNDKASRCF
jgi:glutathione synthase/RimK-type ligase-like ATP-grasp enzyme